MNKIPFNHELKGETYLSVEKTLKSNKAHCFEGALVASAALMAAGFETYLLDLRTTNKDIDHVVAIFKQGKLWGAISKTNHAVLRYRDPVYRDVRELAMSYFNEYFLDNGQKTLREFSKPFDLKKRKENWISGEGNLISLVEALDKSPHEKILPKGLKLRKVDRVEIKAGQIKGQD